MLPTVRASLVAAAAAPPRREAVRPPRRHHRWAIAAATCAVVLMAIAALTATTRGAPGSRPPELSAHSMTAAVGTGSVAGAEVWWAARTIAASTPLPPGRYEALAWVAPLARDGRPVNRTALATWVERRAICQWYRYWLQGSAADREAATGELQAIPQWPAVAGAGGHAATALVAAAATSGAAGPVRSYVTSEC